MQVLHQVLDRAQLGVTRETFELHQGSHFALFELLGDGERTPIRGEVQVVHRELKNGV